MSKFVLDDSDDSVIHQDSEEEDQVEHDDDIDIGFRRHQYETVDNGRPKRARKEDALYGVFFEEEHRRPKRSKMSMESAPIFVSATTKPTKSVNDANPFVAATTDTKADSGDATVNNKNDKDKAEEVTADSLEEREIREKQKAADEHFLSLLNKGRGKRRAKPSQEAREWTRDEQQQNMPNTGGQSMPTSFGSMQKTETAATPKVQSNMGKWEKHTKGIGGKLLAKMGWSGGGGLGSNRRKLKKKAPEAESNEETKGSTDQEAVKARKGISRPVEVVVRPANLGLGFGSFKEASQLKANRQIEAEVRGIELPSESKKEEKESDNFWKPAISSSSMPGTNELLAQKQWKRVRKTKAPKLKVIPYNELIDQQKNKEGHVRIIDMTGPNVTEKESEGEDGQVPLGAELLHNISFLLNTHENKLHSSSHFLTTTERKCTSLQSDIDEMEKRKKDGEERIAKLTATLSIVDQIETLIQQQNGEDNSGMLRHVQGLIQKLGDEFTAEERQSLKFWEMLAPAMLSPIIQTQLDHWEPLHSLKSSQRVIDSVFAIGRSSGGSEGLRMLRNSVIQTQLLPKIKHALDSPRWIPSRDIDVALDMYEYVLQKAVEISPKKSTGAQNRDDGNNIFVSDDEEELKDTLSKSVKKTLMFDTILPRIQGSLRHWKPSLRQSEKGGQIDQRLDLWILPWLQHLDYLNALPNLIADCRKKTKSSLEFLHRKISDDMEFLRSAVAILKPWKLVFDSQSVQQLVSTNVTPRLARCLAKQRIDENALQQEWGPLTVVCDMHGDRLISDLEFLSIIEGEVLAKWARVVQNALINSGNVSQAVQNYATWKGLMLTKKNPDTKCGMAESSLQLLQQDGYICMTFYSVLRMIELTNSSKGVSLVDLSVPVTNFRIVLARRTRDQHSAKEDDFIRSQSRSEAETEARVRLQRRNIRTPTFREVVEEYARERGVFFQPRMGANSLKDGRQTFYFGETPIYIESGVVFALKEKEWEPVPLEQLSAK
eukprot:scaffold346_cov116-Cylindrotheca_fusiformis.AAC.22